MIEVMSDDELLAALGIEQELLELLTPHKDEMARFVERLRSVDNAVLAKLAGKQEPLFWVRLYRDGSFRGQIHNGFIEDTWKASKMWTPLFTHPAPPTKPITKDAIRAAGGIVHSDGNIFFTNMAQIEALRENLK